jgi:hypothetical protein
MPSLQVDTAGVADGLFVGRAVTVVLAFDRAIGDVDVLLSDIDVGEEMFAHEIVEALRVRGGQAEVFVEIEGDDTRKVEALFAVEAGEFLVHADGGAAGGEAEADGGISADGVRYDAGPRAMSSSVGNLTSTIVAHRQADYRSESY